MPAEDAAHGLKHGFEVNRPVEDREGALAEGRGEAAGALPRRRLGRAHDHRGRGLIEAAEKLEDPRSARRG